ncbi:MAG: sensor histidine kinase [Polyangiaceae bacterium]|nr:sensor histidine kinase [Polyangiaceae bacterium]
MGSDRLTKNELSWLFAQEARSAAVKLRAGVTIPPPDAGPPLPAEESTAGVEGALNRLDEAVSALASLHGHPIGRGRRGKIDVAALLWEIAPEAKVQIEMGQGTAVFGDESELRRMLQVLLAQSGDPSGGTGTQEIAVRRRDDVVRVECALGPDTSATHETERAWLSRMAVRYGGRLDLEGGVQVLSLAADVDETQRELDSLKKELAAAQAQGEAYARELAALFSRAEGVVTPPSVAPRSSQRAPSDDSLPVLIAATRSIGAELRGILSAIGREVAPLRGHLGEVGEAAGSVARHVTAASEVLSDLARLGTCPIGELPRVVDVVDMLREIIRDETARIARHDVKVNLSGAESAQDVVPAGALGVLLHALFAHALDATPPGETITISIDAPPAVGALGDSSPDIAVTFHDGGSTLAPGALSAIYSRDFESLAPGRRATIELVSAHAIATHLRVRLSIEPHMGKGARVRVDIPRSI